MPISRFICVSDTPDVEHVILGDKGLIHGVRKGSVVVDMSTISPVATRRFAEELAKRGADMLDAPVSGGEVGAVNATLSIMTGGKPEVFARVQPYFEAMGKNIVLVGAQRRRSGGQGLQPDCRGRHHPGGGRGHDLCAQAGRGRGQGA